MSAERRRLSGTRTGVDGASCRRNRSGEVGKKNRARNNRQQNERRTKTTTASVRVVYYDYYYRVSCRRFRWRARCTAAAAGVVRTARIARAE